MSDFFHPKTEHRSRIDRTCIYCAEKINKGDWYTKQTGVWEGDWFTNHFHDECFKDLCDNGDDEFCPYSNERPAKVLDVPAEGGNSGSGVTRHSTE